jgi:Tol biopolymer transport system component
MLRRIAVGCVTIMVLAIAPSASSASEGCPNEALRVEQGFTALPDCRAYEMVTPLDKNGGDIDGDGNTILASESGNGVTLAARTGFGDTAGSGAFGITQYLAIRSGESWVTHGVTPMSRPNVLQAFFSNTAVDAFSGELDHGVAEGYALPGAVGGIPDRSNLYLEDTATRRLQTISTPIGPEEVTEEVPGWAFRGGSSDFGVVTFEAPLNLVSGATGGNPKLYAFEHGALRLAGVLPDGTIPSGGSSAARGAGVATEFNDTVSREGSRVIFMSPADGSSSAQLYMRKNGTSTVWISQSEASSPVSEPHNVELQRVSPDGTKVLFTTTDRLLDSDPGGAGYGLYLYSDSANPETDSNLTFIARTGSTPVLGMSEDGTRIYFKGVGLELWDHGITRQVSEFMDKPSMVSSNGLRIAFMASREGHQKMYLYDEPNNELTCVSCPPSGAPVTADVNVAPRATEAPASVNFMFLRRFFSNDGRYVFFNTTQGLLPQDTNNLTDVYEYDADTRELSLLSSGTGEDGSWFAQASPSGRDVFLVTRQRLSRWDTDALVDLYDIRIDGGLPGPPQPAVPCAGDACQGTPTAAPSFNTASGFSGLGNPVRKPAVNAKPRSLTRAQRLASALRACKKQPRHKRARCEARVRKRFRANVSTKHTSRRIGR